MDKSILKEIFKSSTNLKQNSYSNLISEENFVKKKTCKQMFRVKFHGQLIKFYFCFRIN